MEAINTVKFLESRSGEIEQMLKMLKSVFQLESTLKLTVLDPPGSNAPSRPSHAFSVADQPHTTSNVFHAA